MPTKAAVFAWLGVLLAPPHLNASDVNQLFELSLEELTQIQVTVASRSSQKLRDAASAVTVFTEADLRRMGIRTLAELLAYVPGMRSYRNSGTSPWLDSYESRGIRDDYNTMLLLMVDGRRLNNPYNGGTAQMFQHSLANAERVEIIRGPGSALYGSSALLGVINIISRTDANQAYLGVGNNGAREASVSASFNTDDWRGNAHLNHLQSDGQRYTDIFDVNDRVSSIRDPVEANDWSAMLGYRQFELYGRSSSQQLDAFYQVNFVHPDNRTEQDVRETGLRGQWQSTDGNWQFSSQLSRTLIDQYSYANRAEQGTGAFLAADWLGGFLVEMAVDTVTFDAEYRHSATQTFNAGLRRSSEEIEQASLYSNYRLTDGAYVGSVQAVNPLMPPTDRDITGVYLQGQQQWSTQWQTTLGVRYDKYGDFGSATSPRLAVQFHASEQDTIKLMFGRAYRAPALNELFTTGNPVSLGNADLDAVHSRTSELQWLHESAQWRLEASVFEQTIRDQITSEFIAPGLRQFTNTGELKVRGAELDWLLPLGSQWRSRVQLSWIADVDESLGNSTGQSSAEDNTPRHSGGTDLSYAADHWSWHIAAEYIGHIDELPDQDGYWLWRTHAIWSLAEPLELSLTINNLFDQDYRTLSALAGFGLNDAGQIERSLPGRGRDSWLRLSWRW